MLIDSTLREGGQQFGNYLGIETRKRIILELASIGVDEIELGWIGQESLEELVRWCRAQDLGPMLSVWSPCRTASVEEASRLGIDRINICVPVSQAHLSKRLGLDIRGAAALVRKVIAHARGTGIASISLGLEDVTRAERSQALGIARAAVRAGASRIRLSDTVGVCSPGDMAELVTAFGSSLADCRGVELAVHCHNDFGMATANAIAALKAGAAYADVSVLGLGERAGIASLEEVAAYAALHMDAPYRLERLRALSLLVAQGTGRTVPDHRPVVGQEIFACESGLHAHGLEVSPDLYEPFSPARVGLERKLRVGGKSGRAAVRMAAKATGISCSDVELSTLVDRVRKKAWEKGRPLSPHEFSDLLQTVADKREPIRLEAV